MPTPYLSIGLFTNYMKSCSTSRESRLAYLSPNTIVYLKVESPNSTASAYHKLGLKDTTRSLECTFFSVWIL
jgi:hypothetical protein